MATRIYTKQARNLDSNELRQCYGLTLRNDGDMMYMLKSCRRSSKQKTHTYLLKEDGKRILAWAIVFDTELEPSAYFYVRKPYRQRGLGKRLIKRILREWPGVVVYPHDEPSEAFFSNYKQHVTIHG